jgi:hypothetical protein
LVQEAIETMTGAVGERNVTTEQADVTSVQPPGTSVRSKRPSIAVRLGPEL